MPKYNIHIDKPLPTSEQIARHKNFGKVFLDYERATRFTFWRDLRTNPRYFATLVMVLAIGYLIFEVSKKERMAEMELVSAPLQVDIPYEYKNVQTETGAIVEFGPDAKVSLPPFAFVDSSGKDVRGSIQLAYREFRDARDLFIAGIPMDADSVSSGKLLDSGGMVEILAFQNGKRVFVKPGVRISISFLSDRTGEDYQVYRLDQLVRAWQFHGKDTVSILLEDSEILKILPPKPRPRVLQIRTPIPTASEDISLTPKSARLPSYDPVYERQLEKWNQLYQQTRDSLEGYAVALRRFSVDQLGYFCIGKKLEVPSLKYSFRIEGIKEAIGNRFWVTQDSMTSLWPQKIASTGPITVSLYPERFTYIWIPLEEGKLGVLNLVAFGDQPARVRDTFKLTVFDGPFETDSDLKVIMLGQDQ